MFKLQKGFNLNNKLECFFPMIMAFVTAVNIWMNVFPIYDSKCAKWCL